MTAPYILLLNEYNTNIPLKAIIDKILIKSCLKFRVLLNKLDENLDV